MLVLLGSRELWKYVLLYKYMIIGFILVIQGLVLKYNCASGFDMHLRCITYNCCTQIVLHTHTVNLFLSHIPQTGSPQQTALGETLLASAIRPNEAPWFV